MPETRTWNGPAYDRVSGPQEEWSRAVIDRLELRGDETVLDAGCGSGRVTELLLEQLPRGRVIGVDASASMIEAARERLGQGADLRVADLVGLDLGAERVDVVFSTATFHWIADHDGLFRSLRGAMRAGGRLVAQCGGAGNVKAVHGAAQEAAADDRFAAHFAGWQGPWNFAAPDETDRRLRDAGFRDARCWLAERPVTPDDLKEFLRTIVLGEHLDQLPADLHDDYLDTVIEHLDGHRTIDYVRLNIDATAA